MDNTVETENLLEYRWSDGILYSDNYVYAGIKTKNLREYRIDGMHAVDFDYACLKCGNWHEHKERQKTLILVVTLTAPCGFSALFALPALKPE